MQPPIRFTGNPNLDLIIFIVGVLAALYWLRPFRLPQHPLFCFFYFCCRGSRLSVLASRVAARPGRRPAVSSQSSQGIHRLLAVDGGLHGDATANAFAARPVEGD